MFFNLSKIRKLIITKQRRFLFLLQNIDIFSTFDGIHISSSIAQPKNLAIFQPVQPFFGSNRYKPAIKDRD